MKLRQVLSEVPGRICLTTDLWRAITIEGYLCLTAHYVDAEWNLRAKMTHHKTDVYITHMTLGC